MMKIRLGLGGTVILLLWALSGAWAEDLTIALEYRPKAQGKNQPPALPPAKIFFEDIRDERPRPNQVGENLENKNRPSLVVTRDPRAAGQLVRQGLISEFQKKGFAVVDQPDRAEKILSGSIVEFWTVETTRYLTRTRIRIEVRDHSGKSLFQKTLSGTGKIFGRSFSEIHYSESMSDSLVMIADALMIDPEFFRALTAKSDSPPPVRVGKPETQTASPPAPAGPPAPLPVDDKKTAPLASRIETPEPPPSSPPLPPPSPKQEVPQPSKPPEPSVTAKGTEAIQPEDAPSPVKQERFAAEDIEHRVIPGETLATIAKWYSGESTRWPELAKHNPDMHPFRLKGGAIVRVPKALAVVHNEQPDHSTAPKIVSKPTPKPSKPPAAPSVPASPTPSFGPK